MKSAKVYVNATVCNNQVSLMCKVAYRLKKNRELTILRKDLRTEVSFLSGRMLL